MAQNIAAIGNKEFLVGFQLAGIKKTYDIAKTTIQQAMKEPSIGILVLDRRDVDQLPDHVKLEVEGSVKPTTVILSEDASSAEALRRMVKKSIGVDVWEK